MKKFNNIINNLDGPLKRHSSKRNSLFDFEGGKNYDSFSFKPGRSGLAAYKEELERLKNVCRSLCKDLPSATFQYRERTNWRWLSQDGSIEATILFCRNLDHHKLLQLASFLTSCAVSFRFNSANTIVINTAGLDSSILVRLMHYAEVPIPTTMKQGAFSLSIKGNGLSTGDRNFLSFDLKIGRIGALPSVPVQIRCTSVEGLITLPLHQSTIGRWIKKELSGFNISEVVCVDEDQVTDTFLQFRVPIEDESSYPKVFKYKNKTFSVDHALPYATPIGMRARPPQEESVHDHWKKAARLAPQEKISHVNCVAKTENCPKSLQRVMSLRESSVKASSYTVFMYVEQTKMPWCFFTGSVSQQTALDCFSKHGIHHLESKEEIEAVIDSHSDKKQCLNRDVEGSATVHIVKVQCDDDQPVRMGLFCEGKYGWTVSTAELVQCHAYTPCILVSMVPPGCKLADLCSPRRHFTTLQVIPLPNPNRSRCETSGATDSQLTQISPNRTAVPVSPDDVERYTQRSLSPIKPSSEAISPTATWTEVASEQITSKEENRQMPLLRRSSDQATHQSSQSLLKLKDPKLPRETTATQSERYIRNEDDCNRWPKEDKQSKRSDEGKTKAIVPSEQKVALKDAAKEHAEAKLSPCDDHENGSKQSGKVPSGNLSGKDTSVIPKDTSLREDTKTKGNYTNAVGGEGTLIETLAKDIGIDLLEAKRNGQQQYVADTRNSHNTLSGCGLQVFDAEMKDIKDIKHNADSRKRGVKKDLVSKSCPPMLRATSPKMNAKQSESKERNQRALQRATLSKTRDSSQTGKSRNRVMGKDESVVPETSFLQDGYGPDSEVSRLTHQMQDMKGVEQVDCQIVDLIAKIEQENAEQKRERLARVTDATQKWCSCLPSSHQERIISLGEKFLRRMDSTLCYLIVVYRMLAKASWTRSMVAVDIKQAALYAISRGWYVKKASDVRDYPFTRGEFAVSAATYLDKIPSDAPEDPFRALYIVISHLPFSCARLFSKGQVSCPYCLESCEVSFPSFTSRVSWTMANWTDLATCLNSAEPNPWMHSFGWHATECNRSDHNFTCISLATFPPGLTPKSLPVILV